jgi:hypothetical protein
VTEGKIRSETRLTTGRPSKRTGGESPQGTPLNALNARLMRTRASKDLPLRKA